MFLRFSWEKAFMVLFVVIFSKGLVRCAGWASISCHSLALEKRTQNSNGRQRLTPIYKLALVIIICSNGIKQLNFIAQYFDS